MSKELHLPSFIRTTNRLTLAVTILLFVGMFGVGSIVFKGFFSLQVFLNLFIDNAYLGIVAIGMTFVIITKGIDLSVGAVIAMCTMIAAFLLEKGMDPILVITIVILSGVLLGLIIGVTVSYFNVPPFIATLAGMFFARGFCYVISIDSIPISNDLFVGISNAQIILPTGEFITWNVVIFFVLLVAAILLANKTRFGRVIFAIGGNKQSALLMGLPVRQTEALVYAFSGFCSSIAGIVFAFYTLSGYSLHCQGTELDAIAASVIGGTLLTGGVGSVLGSLFGTLIIGTIQTLISFNGTLSAWWTKIFVGAIIFIFILMQTLLSKKLDNRSDSVGES